jgi:hypothetical protein
MSYNGQVRHSRIKILITTLLVVAVFGIWSLSDADNSPVLGVSSSDVTITTSPENPQPYQDVTVTLTSYSTDLNKAMIEWKNGGTTLLSGYGKTTYSFKALGPNTQVTIEADIAPSEGGSPIVKTITINPSEIDLLWEGVGAYTPPFYRGKAFVSQQGQIKVIAIPDTSIIKTGKGNITYTWKNNGQVIQDVSGYGKDSYTFTNSELNNVENIGVEAGSVDGQYDAVGTIAVPIVAPKLIFYQKSPSEGILFNQSLGSQMNVSADQATIVAAPYYLALKGNENNFTYTWQINGADIDTPSKKTELTIHPTSHGGYATIGLTLENPDTLFQKVTGALKLNL